MSKETTSDVFATIADNVPDTGVWGEYMGHMLSIDSVEYIHIYRDKNTVVIEVRLHPDSRESLNTFSDLSTLTIGDVTNYDLANDRERKDLNREQTDKGFRVTFPVERLRKVPSFSRISNYN